MILESKTSFEKEIIIYLKNWSPLCKNCDFFFINCPLQCIKERVMFLNQEFWMFLLKNLFRNKMLMLVEMFASKPYSLFRFSFRAL